MRTRPLLCASFALGAALALPAQAANQIGIGCPGSNGIPTLSSPIGPTVGQSITLSLTNLPPGGGLNWWSWGTESDLWGAQTLPVDLAFVGAPGCMVWISPTYTTLALQPPQPTVDLTLEVPTASFLIGCRFLSQVFVCDFGVNPLGYTSTNGLELLFAP